LLQIQLSDNQHTNREQLCSKRMPDFGNPAHRFYAPNDHLWVVHWSLPNNPAFYLPSEYFH
jgi:hypothetical protein